MKILLVGGTGVLSSAVAETALRRGDSVTMINRGRRPIIEGCCSIVADRHDYLKIADALNGKSFDVVIDFLVFNRDDAIQSYNFFRNKTEQYILVSSCLVYDFSKGGIMREDSPRGLSCWKYSGGKCEAEDVLVEISAESSNCKYTIIRPFVTYGNTRIPYSLAPKHGCDWTMVFRALAGKPIITWDGGRGRCNIMRVEDFCTGLFGLMKNERAYGEAVNVCGDESPCWKDVITALEDAVGIKIPVIDLPKEFVKEHYPQRSEEIDGRSYEVTVSNEKLKRLVPSFRSTITLRDGVAKTVSAYRAKSFQNGVDWVYDVRSDEVANAWYKRMGIRKRCRFVDYLGSYYMNDYLKYINASSCSGVAFRLFRRCLNFGLRRAGGVK